MKYKPNKYTGKSLMMNKGSKVMYNKGGYASIKDMEKHCSLKTTKNTMK